MQLLEFQAKRAFFENMELIYLTAYLQPILKKVEKHAKRIRISIVIKIQVPVGGRGKARRHSKMSK